LIATRQKENTSNAGEENQRGKSITPPRVLGFAGISSIHCYCALNVLMMRLSITAGAGRRSATAKGEHRS
jgi:hypothetical protein